MNCILSFILPCYNVARYIGECIDSLYAQNMPETEFEVICVDDCSTDNTVEVIKEYQQKHSNIILHCHELNQTAGGARNTGMSLAKGEYIWFVDPDDAICKESLKPLLDKMRSDNLDMLLFNYFDADVNLNVLRRDNTFSDSALSSGQDFVMQYFPQNISTLGLVWRCIYKKSFLQDKSLRYPQIRKSQDVVFAWKTLLSAERMASISQAYYVFRSNPNSVTHAAKTPLVLYSERFQFGAEVDGIIRGFSLRNEIRCQLERVRRWCANPDWSEIKALPKAGREEYRRYLNSDKRMIVRLAKYMNKKTMLMILAATNSALWNKILDK